MKINCLCDPCIKDIRYGFQPAPHYIYTKTTKLEKLLISLREQGKLSHLGKGRHRETYLSPSGKTVIKFPISYDGILANKSERDLYTGRIPTSKIEANLFANEMPKKENLAGCRMVGYSILMMTKVSTVGIDDDFVEDHAPNWVQSIDCYQVGWHPITDELVAFDYSAV